MKGKLEVDPLEGLSSISSDVKLLGTRVERQGAADMKGLPEAEKKQAHEEKTEKEAPLVDQEIQLRGLRRAVVEQVIRAIRQIRDTRPPGSTTTKDQKVWDGIFAMVERTDPEKLYQSSSDVVRRIRNTKLAPSLAGTEEGALITDMKSHIETALKMTRLFDDRSSIRENGGLREIFPDLQKDFTDVTAPHVDSFNRAVTDGMDELLKELRGGLDIEAVQAVPKYFILSLKNVKDKRADPKQKGKLVAKKKFKDPADWDGAAGGVEKRVTEALSTPSGAMVVRFCRAPHIAPFAGEHSWVITLERAPEPASEFEDDEEEEENIMQIKSRKKRLQKLLAQKPVEEREAGGARRLLRTVEEALAGDATADLQKVYARSEISKVLVGWAQLSTAADGPHTTPCGRAALHKIFKAWAEDFVQLCEPSSRDRHRQLMQPFAAWLESDPSAAPTTPTPTPATTTSAKKSGKKRAKAAALAAPLPSKRRRHGGSFDGLTLKGLSDPKYLTSCGGDQAEAFVGKEGRQSLLSEGSGSAGAGGRVGGFDSIDYTLKASAGVGEEGRREAGMRQIVTAEAGDAEQQFDQAAEDSFIAEAFGGLPSAEGEAADAAEEEHETTNAAKRIKRSGIADPGLPTGGLEGLRALHRILVETPGSPVHPQSHRLHKSNYTAPLMVKVTYSYCIGQNAPLFGVSDWVFAGEVPVMVRSDVCMLADRTPGELSRTFYEESREPGGYFVMGGNERVLRMVLAARGNHPITIERASFANKGPSFTSKCVYIRSVKRSGIAVPNYLYMLASGKIILSFSRGTTWQIPLSLILLALGDNTTPLQLAEAMSSDAESDKWAAAFMNDVYNQVQLARHYVGADSGEGGGAPAVGFPSSAAHWQYILGKYLAAHRKLWVREVVNRCRARLGAGCFDSEVYRLVGLWALREHILPHLNDYAMPFEAAVGERQKKIDALLVMVKKLVMFQSGRLREEGEDGLVNQEVITPGQLWLQGVMDSVLAVGRALRSSLSILGLTDNRAREGWESLRPPTLDDFADLCCGTGEVRLRELIWSYFWQRRRVEGSAKPASQEQQQKLLQQEVNSAPEGGAVSTALYDITIQQETKDRPTEFYWKMRYERDDSGDDGRKGNRQRVLSEPTYPVCFMVSTGNYTQEPLLANGASLPQSSGWSVVVERINQFRFLEQFRATHRGKTIQEMRTTTPRRYQMDGWGFLCIVHTPDGGPCGVMNHLSYPTQVVCGLSTAERVKARREVVKAMKKLPAGGFAPRAAGGGGGAPSSLDTGLEYFPVMLDTELLGYVREDFLAASKLSNTRECIARNAGTLLRNARSKGDIPNAVEIVAVDPKWVLSSVGLVGVTKDKGDTSCKAPKLYPGIYLFSGPGRLSRPIRKVGSSGTAKGSLVWVGTQEQIFLDIAALHKDLGMARKDLGAFDYVEVSTTTALSLTASLIPYFEMNCSPRNLFQCGMAKQTMGSCFHSVVKRNDNKLYFTHGCQAALLRTDNQHMYQMDDYPNGINVVLAVAAYTGFDMEDALLINKTSVERGLFQGSVYLGTILQPFESDTPTHYTRIPSEGQYLTKGDVYAETNTGKRETWSKPEAGRVHSVEVLQTDLHDDHPIRVRVIFRIERTPVIGDKFAARHGQKGTLPLLVPQHEMPFAGNGVVPDVIINPHAFPSRMTVGMLIEMIAAKYAAVKGTFPDATAWSEVADQPIHATRMGNMLGQLGYSHTGAEMLTHGATGEQMQCDIYTGICYYQRLRHMVDDKYQARERADKSSGVDPLTGQPVKGRKKGGGIRVGEMERDALIAHGTLQVGQDRLLKSSDLGIVRTCAACCSTPCTCEDGGVEHYRFAPKALDFMNTQLRAMGVAMRTLPQNTTANGHQ